MTTLVSDRPAPGVLRLRLDGEDTLNALDEGAKDQLLHALACVSSDNTTRVVMLTGTGRAFCAGGDVRAMGERTAVETVQVLAKGRQITERIVALNKPVVAAVNGIASGAGFNLALACDVVLAHRSAWFQQSFVRLGLIPDMGGTYFLAQQVGLYRAKEILLSARRIRSEEALELGFVSHVYGDDFAEQCLAYCADLARGATQALAVTKLLTNRAVEGSLQAALDKESLGQAVVATTHDHRAAVSAFREKRPLDSVNFIGE
ncbi:Enoyl-CoA hydratase [Micromonospora pallida]|uniref:Enoyl-CoA hydratase n=1 Tax=Micromonospora pallida TaxID=145854 RepID=A0A1C6RSM5_9ACTN|nr:enoyl-CoA hydratase-related protein [Micromonospora pallida]SCL20190.1 Enoyl-CoA hydratase [Micromonospora pallida]